jgi:hypothetical protein
MTTVCKPLYVMILRWVLDGTLEDPYAEFFIASDNKVQVDEKSATRLGETQHFGKKLISQSYIYIYIYI